MKNKPFKLGAIACLLSISFYAQQFETPLQEYKANSDVAITIEASYAEIEIIEWNKNKVEVQGIMTIQGLPQDEAQNLFNDWDISTQATADKISIRSKSSDFGHEYFFIHSDKYMGNVVVDIPHISSTIVDIMDSVNFVLPEFENFPDINIDIPQSFHFDHDSIDFDFEDFQNSSEYLKQWQEQNKEQLERLKEELKENRAEMALSQKEMQKEMEIAKAEVQKAMKEVRKEMMEVEVKVKKEMEQYEAERKKMIEKGAKEREYQIKKIMEKRQKVKVKKTIRIKVPKNARLQMDVDYCKITTIK